MRPSSKVHVVFDCNVLIQAAASGLSASSASFRLVEEKIVVLVASDKTLSELKNVLSRDVVKEKLRFSNSAVEEFLETIEHLAKTFTKVPGRFELPRDVDDEEYLNLAIESEADFLVTRDKDLLDLMNGYDEVGKRFRQQHRNIKIVDPLNFLKIIEDKLKEDMSIAP